MSKRLGLLTALFFSALLTCIMPSLLTSLMGADQNRMDISLRPAITTTLTVWVTSDQMGDSALYRALLSDFEKAHEDIRLFLRVVDSTELYAEDAVLPDIVLFSLGDLINPSDYLLPLSTDSYDAGSSGGVQYGQSLWYAPMVLSIPNAWLTQEIDTTQTPQTTSFFDLGTPAPEMDADAPSITLSEDDLPFEYLLTDHSVIVPSGVALLQLMTLAPSNLQTPWLNILQNSEPTSEEVATVQTLADYTTALAKGADTQAYLLSPPMNDQLRLIGLCKQSEEALTFLSYLTSDEASTIVLSHHFLPIVSCGASSDPLTSALQAHYAQGVSFANAFEYTKTERNALCLDALTRDQDPIETFLRLR